METISKNKILSPKAVIEILGITNGMRVADFGSGALGHFIIPVAQAIGEEGVAYAIDIQKDVLSQTARMAAMKGLDNLLTVWSNVESYGATKIQENSLD